MVRCKVGVNVVNVAWKIFYADCRKVNIVCNSASWAYVPAVTVCQQSL